uniref:Putative secreted peptide n=1 Tax=Anopheles braziliensis TaxID=58242 RepID=A0A2M3ZMQ2_9DIPT
MQLLGILPVLLSVCCVVLPRVLLLRGCATLASFLTVSGVWVYFTETELRSHRCHHNSSTRRIRGGASGWLGVSDTDGIGVEGVAALGRPGWGAASFGGGARLRGVPWRRRRGAASLKVGCGFGMSLGDGVLPSFGARVGWFFLRGPAADWFFLQGPAELAVPSGSGCKLTFLDFVAPFIPGGPGRIFSSRCSAVRKILFRRAVREIYVLIRRCRCLVLIRRCHCLRCGVCGPCLPSGVNNFLVCIL